ncbi:MAG: hypothetical protein GVY25_11020 [Bacteroidetes bacterium]|jgi:hypothetical protein|nr:hypothetical protein [Bacteroidota bacterium]
MGDGEGRFKRLEADLTGVQHGTSAFGDVNSDGHLDRVISGRDPNNDRITTLYFGDGEGGFTTVE